MDNRTAVTVVCSARKRRLECGFAFAVLALVLGCGDSEPSPAVDENTTDPDGETPPPEPGPLEIGARYITSEPSADRFTLVASGSAAPIVVSAVDHPGVVRVASDLRTDIERVTGVAPEVITDAVPEAPEVVVLGTLGRSPLIDELVESGKLAVSDVQGRWEMSLVTVVEQPWPGVERALVLLGSDFRGSIYAAYDLSRQMGVSPWHYWDDVPARHQDALYALPGRYSEGEPAVKYRGFFINDEAPQLATWAANTFGPGPNPAATWGFDHELYAKVYEVMLRLKGNYLWPAVWGRSLFDDDPENTVLAAQYGIVTGTSHEAPMMRAQDEWNRYGMASGPFGGTGEFSFVRNAEPIKEYWREGIRRNGDYESLVTIGMRGNGDTGLEDAQGIPLMESIVSAQRQILAEEFDKDVATIPQVWTLYKEVQGYWDEGMRAPDDVTIIWCDDNWGNMRGLPNQADPPRAGGYGIYYHFDYVGGGRNYKWVDSSNLASVWEQLNLSYQYGVKQVFMVNVGDLKNAEHSLSFFLDYAWAPDRLPIERLHDWEVAWAEQQFGTEYASEIATVLSTYHQLQARRKPELLNRSISLNAAADIKTSPATAVVYTDDSPYSLTHYEEAERVVSEWKALAVDTEGLYQLIPAEYRDAYYQLVHYQVVASANLYELRLAQFKNILYARQGRAATADMAKEAEFRFAEDLALSAYYNTELAGGKWRGFQTQAKLGYGGPYPNSSWQQPEGMPDFIWPELQTITLPEAADLGVAVSGSTAFFPTDTALSLPELSPFQTLRDPYIEVFNRGLTAFDVQLTPSVDWVTLSTTAARVTKELRVRVSVDWARAPSGVTEVPITIAGPNATTATVTARVNKPTVERSGLRGFVEANGYISIEAEHFDRNVDVGGIGWKLLPGAGRTGSSLTPFPVTAARQDPLQDAPRLEYDIEVFTTGPVTVWAYLSPRLPIQPTDGLKYAISIDDAAPQIVNTTAELNGLPDNRSWERNTSDNVNLTPTTHMISTAGRHVLKFWMVDPAVVVQKLVVNTGGLGPSYLGPPESLRAGAVEPE